MSDKLDGCAARLRDLITRLAAEDVPGGLLDRLSAIATEIEDLAYEREHGRPRWCRCADHPNTYEAHEAAHRALAEERRRLDAEREAARRAAEGERPEVVAGWV